MKRGVPIVLGIGHAAIPLYPAFIVLTTVTVPGVALLPRSVSTWLLVAVAAMGLYLAICLLLPPREAPPTLLPLLGWLTAGVLAAVLGFDPLAGAIFIGIFALGILWHLTILRYYREPGVASAIFWAQTISGLIAAAAAIAMVILRVPADQYAIGHGRAIGTFIVPGELAGYLIIYLPLSVAVARAAHSRWLRIFAWSGVVVGTIAFVMTFSRAGWLGLAAAVAFFIVMMRGRVRLAALAVAVGTLAVLAVFNEHHNPSENYTRLSIWQAAIEMIQRFPLTGVGPFDFARIYPFVRLPNGEPAAFHAHSFLLTIFAETGAIGVLAVLWAWWRFVLALRDRLRIAAPASAALALFAVAGLVGTWVQGLIDTVSVVIFGMWLPTMALALVLARDGLAEAGE